MAHRPRVAIVGGGMAGLTAAWRLSDGDWRERLESITLYERSGVLGGKGASVRGVNGRIEEHGLHVWLGYYHNAFRLMREVYTELDRPTTDPGCPIATFDDAFVAAPSVGVHDLHDGQWSTWVGKFASNSLEVGATDVASGELTVADLVRRLVEMLLVVLRSLEPSPRSDISGVHLSASPTPPRHQTTLGTMLRRAEVMTIAAGVQGLSLLGRVSRAVDDGLGALVAAQLDELRATMRARLLGRDAGRQLADVFDLAAGCAIAAVEDGLLRGDGFSRIDHLDFREWLGNRVEPATLDSPIVRGLYDLVFAYERGDRRRPRFAAGLGLFLANRLFFEYRGAIFWKMRAGMGDVVFAPLYQALVRRGVRIELHHRLERIELDGRGGAVSALHLVQPSPGQNGALRSVRGLPCFTSEARQPVGSAPTEVRVGRDVDTVVLTVPVGVVPSVGRELVARHRRWRQMAGALGTVATQAAQLWVEPSARELGAREESVTTSGYAPPFDTYSSMSHLVDMEEWPAGKEPRTIGYFCGALADVDAIDPTAAGQIVRRNAEHLLDRDLGPIWPGGVDDQGRLRPGLVRGGEDRSVGMYTRANTDPSDRYVQSLPGSGRYRLRADQAGVDHLVLAGDWINCGMNAGCIEAAVMSGIQAANVVLERPLTEGLAGRWYGLGTNDGR